MEMKPARRAIRRPFKHHGFVIVVALVLASFFSLLVSADKDNTKDLYAILGVPRTASPKEIKSAYRRKALDTHPDKNKGVPAEEAAVEFHGVVHAFEVLSDPASRRRYDSGGGDGTESNAGAGRGGYSHAQWQFFHQRRQTVHLKDMFEVRQAQSRVLHVVGLDQLRTIMLDDNDRLERHLLICFFTPSIEKLVTDEIVFPYPFAGMSPQSIWWEDILQTVAIRVHRSNELTRYFDVDGIGGDMTEPVFLFAKRGSVFGKERLDKQQDDGTQTFFTHATKDRASFESWMWTRMEAKVTFHNHHNHPVEIYWIHRNQAHVKEVIVPNSSWVHYSMLTHEFYARDVRVDSWPDSPGRWQLGPKSGLGSWKIGIEGKDNGLSAPIREDGSVVIDIPLTHCFDLSGHCQFWANRNECRKNPEWMGEKCMLTCGNCSASQEERSANQEEQTTSQEEQTCEN